MTTFLTLLLPFALSQFYRAFLAVVAGDLGRDLALGPAELGTISAAWFWAFAAAQLPLGLALDLFGPRRTLALTMLAAVAGAVCLALATSGTGAVVAMALIGIGCSPILMAGYYVLARLYDVRRFALMSSLLLGFGSLGDPLSATPLALAVAAFGWRAAMLGIAAVTLVSAILVWCLLRDPPPVPDAGPQPSFLGGLREMAAIRALWPILPLVFVGYGVMIAVRGLWIAPFLQTVHGFDATARGHAALAMGFAVGLGALAYGPLARWLGGPKPTALVGTLATAGCLAGLWAWGDRSGALAVALLTGVGFFGITYALLMAHGRAFVPARLLGRGVTFLNFAFMCGGGVIQSLSGRFVQGAGGAGLSPAATYGRLHLGLALALAGAAAIYVASRPDGAATRPAPSR